VLIDDSAEKLNDKDLDRLEQALERTRNQEA
jgi:hypothetical protein